MMHEVNVTMSLMDDGAWKAEATLDAEVVSGTGAKAVAAIAAALNAMVARTGIPMKSLSPEIGVPEKIKDEFASSVTGKPTRMVE